MHSKISHPSLPFDYVFVASIDYVLFLHPYPCDQTDEGVLLALTDSPLLGLLGLLGLSLLGSS